ncbi:MAG: hypothetical protein AAF664_02520 [Planctomycetota bacterium]
MKKFSAFLALSALVFGINANTVLGDTDSQIFKVTIDSALDIDAPDQAAVEQYNAAGANTVIPTQTWNASGNVANGVKLTFSMPQFVNGSSNADGILELGNPTGSSVYTIPSGSDTADSSGSASLIATTTGPIDQEDIEVTVTMVNPTSPVAGDYVTTVTGTIEANP